MRVLMLSWEYPPHIVGGLGQHVADLVPALAEAGVELHVITPVWSDTSAEADPPGATIHRVFTTSQGDIMAQALEVNEALSVVGSRVMEKTGQFDLIHAHDWLVSFAAITLKERYRVPLLATIHATEYGRSQGWLATDLSKSINAAEWRLAYDAWRVIVCSNFMATELIANLGVPPDKIDVIPNGVHTETFDALNKMDLSPIRLEFALPGERLVFNIGRMVPEKGLHVLVEAMPIVLKHVPNAKFVVAGTRCRAAPCRGPWRGRQRILYRLPAGEQARRVAVSRRRCGLPKPL
jgi:glycosyltransferase involved in cell wall biosynthesis